MAYNYFFQFNTRTTAEIDPIVGPFLISGNPYNPLWVYDVAIDGVNTLPGYWCVVVTTTNSALLSHPDLQFVLNRDVQLLGGPELIVNNLIPPSLISDLQIISEQMQIQLFVAPGPSATPPNGYVTEDGLIFYVAEDGATFYVQE